MKKDWRGNKTSVMKTLGADAGQRESKDYYATHPDAVRKLLEEENFNKYIWECACGEGHISKVLESQGYIVKSTDLIDRGYGEIKDFLFFNDEKFDGDIITNPPYAKALEFVKKALEVIPEGNKVSMLLRIQFLEGKERKRFFEKHPPKTVYVFSERIKCAINGDFNSVSSSAMAFCWFVWVKGYRGDTIIKWI